MEAVERASGYLRLLKMVQTWVAPEFPVKGQDLIELGHAPGPDMGQVLTKLEKRWVESGFALKRDSLLSEA